MKLCEYINHLLFVFKIEKVFGVPGSLIMPIWQSVSNAELILCGHEQEAAYVAVGYAKMSHKAAVVLSIGSPGVSNAVSGIASANMDSVPLIYISGRTPVEKDGCGITQEESCINRKFDSAMLLNGVTKQSICIRDPLYAAEQIRTVFADAMQKRCGAVHLSIPIDLQNMEIQVKEMQCRQLDYKDAPAHIALPLTQRPLIIIGWGVWMAECTQELYHFAEIIQAPICVTSKAYCCIISEHPCYLGKLGYGYNPEIDAFLKEYKPDLVIAFGSSLSEKDIGNSVLSAYLQTVPFYVVSNSDSVSGIRNVTAVPVSDMKAFISEKMKTTAAHSEPERMEKIQKCRKKQRNYWLKKIEAHDTMSKAILALSDHECVVTADAGNHLLAASVLLEPKKCGMFFLDTGLRAMGTGICFAVGMAIADQSKHYLAITGDGCMLMNGNVMHIAKALQLPITFLVFNNHALGRVRVGQSVMNDFRASAIHDIDFALYGKAFGLQTYRFDNPEQLASQISAIIMSGIPSLVEIITDPDEVPIKIKGNIY